MEANDLYYLMCNSEQTEEMPRLPCYFAKDTDHFVFVVHSAEMIDIEGIATCLYIYMHSKTHQSICCSHRQSIDVDESSNHHLDL